MIYNLTDKLNFEDNPKIKIKDKTLEVKADAETVLSLVSLLQEKGETQATLESVDLLFSEKDKKILKSLKLSFKDYTTFLNTAITLAYGEDPDGEVNTQGEK